MGTTVSERKGNRRRSMGYCPHLRKSPLQPFQTACTAKSLIVRQLLADGVPSSSFAGNDELVAVKDFKDVGNVLYMIYDRLWSCYSL